MWDTVVPCCWAHLQVEDIADDLHPQTCHYCSAVFFHANAYTRHMSLHQGGAPLYFVCTLNSCSFAADKLCVLLEHERARHRLLSCGECGYRAASQPSMDLHRRRHAALAARAKLK